MFLKCPNKQVNFFCQERKVYLGVSERTGTPAFICCERDYRCDTFGLAEEHLHKVWQEISCREIHLIHLETAVRTLI